jgi:hypothetical protein
MLQEYILCYQNYNKVVLFPNRCQICGELCYPVFPNNLMSFYNNDVYRCPDIFIDIDNFLKTSLRKGMNI